MSTNEHKFVVVHDKVVICGKNKIRYFVHKIYVVYLYVDSVIVSTLIIWYSWFLIVGVEELSRMI